MYIFEADMPECGCWKFVELSFSWIVILWIWNALVPWRLNNKFRSLNHSWDTEIEWVSEDQFWNISNPSSEHAVNHVGHGSNRTVWIWILINLCVGKGRLRRARKRPRRRPLAGAGLSYHCWRTSFELISVP